MACGEWELSRLPDGDIPCRGYWSPPQAVSGLLLLTRRGETWMSLMPVQAEGLQLAAGNARGTVVLFGLGLGWLAAKCALRSEVEQVVVVELDRELIRLHAELALFDRLPDGAGAKVRIVAGDARDWRPDGPVDLLHIDIWQSLAGADRVAEVERMQANVVASVVHFWGQELEIARRVAAAGRAFDEAGLAATVAELGLPLAGTDAPDYAAKVRGVAANWLRERPLSGAVATAGSAAAKICDRKSLDIGERSNEIEASEKTEEGPC